jgi:hypothetical protein
VSLLASTHISESSKILVFLQFKVVISVASIINASLINVSCVLHLFTRWWQSPFPSCLAVLKHHTTKLESKPPLILELSTWWRWAVSVTLQRSYLWYVLACWLVAQSSGLEAKTTTCYRATNGNRSATAQAVASWLCLIEYWNSLSDYTASYPGSIQIQHSPSRAALIRPKYNIGHRPLPLDNAGSMTFLQVPSSKRSMVWCLHTYGQCGTTDHDPLFLFSPFPTTIRCCMTCTVQKASLKSWRTIPFRKMQRFMFPTSTSFAVCFFSCALDALKFIGFEIK